MEPQPALTSVPLPSDRGIVQVTATVRHQRVHHFRNDRGRGHWQAVRGRGLFGDPQVFLIEPRAESRNEVAAFR